MNRSTKQQFIAIIQTHKRILFKIINSYCKDADGRKDLEQEILINIWKSLKTYDDKYTLSTWIYRVALNVAISHYRKDSKRKAQTQSIDECVIQFEDDNTSTTELDENVTLLYAFIDELDKYNKAIMILLLEGNSYKYIAEVLGLTETNVATKINRIKKLLKEKFNNH
jgi:RNA polymerase sigma factor (sigma-70 family)